MSKCIYRCEEQTHEGLTLHRTVGDYLVHEVTLPMIDDLTNLNVKGERLRALAQLASEILLNILIQSTGVIFGKKVIVIGIPRGGAPFGVGANQHLTRLEIHNTLHFSNSGERRNQMEGRINFDVPVDTTDIVITDGVIGAGSEIIAHLKDLLGKLPVDWQGKITILSGLAADMGLNSIAQFMRQRAINNGNLVTGRIYRESGQFSYKGWQTIGDRRVFTIGVGDFGSRVG